MLSDADYHELCLHRVYNVKLRNGMSPCSLEVIDYLCICMPKLLIYLLG